MVDNVVANAGSGGATFASDDIASVHYPRVKVTWGPDGTANDADVASGKALPVQIRTPLGDSAMDDTLDAIKVVGQANSGVDIGDVDVTSVVPGVGATNLGKAEDAAHTTGDTGVMALGVRQAADTPLSGADGDYEPLQMDANGHLKVEVFDGGDSHTVDNAGTFAVQVDGDALTALQLIDDVVATDDTSTHATGTTKGAVMMAAAAPTDGSVDANDLGAVAMSTDRRLHVDSQIVGQDANLTVDLGATDNAVLDAIQAAVEIMDDWDETNRAAVNLISGQAGIAGGTGVDGATVPRVTLATDVGLPAGASLVGDVGISGARTSGGTTLYKNIDVDESEDQVKGTAGQVYWIHAINLTASVVYLKFYNATAATVVVGTTAPDLTFPVPTQGDTNGAGFNFAVPNGIAFGTAITIAATTGLADNDSGAPAANALVVNLGYA
jgi:hypothetical protein